MVISTGRQLLDGYLHTFGLKVYLAKNPPQRTLRWVALRGMILVVGLALFQQQGQGGDDQCDQPHQHKGDKQAGPELLLPFSAPEHGEHRPAAHAQAQDH